MSLKQKKIKLNHKPRCKRHQTSLITPWFIINSSPIYCLVTSPGYWTENWEFRLLLLQSYPYNSLKTIDFNAKNCQCKKNLNIRSWLQPARKRSEYLIKRFPVFKLDLRGNCSYRRTSTNGHLSTTATFFGGQSIHWLLFLETFLQRPLASVPKVAVVAERISCKFLRLLFAPFN